MRRIITAIVLASASFWSIPVSAGAPVPLNATTIIERMLARNPSLGSYQARVHVDVRMLNFPFLAPTLDGVSYFKRPDNYEVIFNRVPSYAKGFSKLFNDVGDPAAWQKDQRVTYSGTAILGGRPMLVLTMTKKIHSSILDHTTAFIDPSNYELDRMEWHYTSGGVIVMSQAYRKEGGFDVISAQHATIDIPHVHAVADSSFSTYLTNVAVNDSVFTNK
ncbi:MAG: hypothetical protein ACYDGM_03955 [Vulcanimicrobiaceae bacterium]